ncbi:uncharacterized protein LOC119104352 [Pollicipes pollicipes]|uniref:uncharacterized protein LOC119104352 n=1 Tax=Pollicipes pollicipes TaxID=41117 RepID=UPI001885908E|nr:uncharacterized protein LOC119104352 [Pollicipes pollicipes]
MRDCTPTLFLLVSAGLVNCRTVFPYLGSGNRFTLRATLPVGFPPNVTFLRVRATSDTYVRPNESRTMEYAVANHRDNLFKITNDGGIRLSREVKFRKTRKERRRYRLNIVAGLQGEAAPERAVLAVEIQVTRNPPDCDAISAEELCWGPWTFLAGMQWFASPPATADKSPFLLDLRCPLHTTCQEPQYSYRANQVASEEEGSEKLLRTFDVEVLDRNNHAPELYETSAPVSNVYLCERREIKKDERVGLARQLYIRDLDHHSLEHYSVRLEGDSRGLLRIAPGHYPLSGASGRRHDGEDWETMLFTASGV